MTHSKLWQKATKLLGLRYGLPHAQSGDAARARSDWIEAVVAYRRALSWMPWREDLKVQIGNCLREIGDFKGAVKAYRSVESGSSRIEALKQIVQTGHSSGEVVLPYIVEEQPSVETRPALLPPSVVTAAMLPGRITLDTEDSRRWLGTLGRSDWVPRRLKGNRYASIKLDQIGSMAIERNGMPEPLLGGVIAIRGRILSLRAVADIKILLGEGEQALTVATIPLRPLRLGAHPMKLHIFNAWIDAGRLPKGRHWLSVHSHEWIAPAGIFVNIVDVESCGELIMSSAMVPSPMGSDVDVDDYVLARPALVRPAARSLIHGEVGSILVIRADQLGDVSASLPAMARLRELYTEAQIVALVQPSVAPIVAASAIVDEVLTIDLPYDHETERRSLFPAEETRLREIFLSRHFDLAIDLSPGDETRPLLMMTGATYLAGFNPDRFPFLDFGVALRSRDKVNQLECVSHAAFVSSLVETLATILSPRRAVVPRRRSSDTSLAEYGLEAKRYILIHTGARHVLNEWPMEKFIQLADALRDRTTLQLAIVALGDGAKLWKAMTFPHVCIYGALEPDTFDAIVANATLMVGNDSGPKHLAAVRGVPTVSIQVGRLNWNEWGQDGQGVILFKPVPCAGCGLNDVQLCGKDVACIRTIEVHEVLGAVLAQLPPETLIKIT